MLMEDMKKVVDLKKREIKENGEVRLFKSEPQRCETPLGAYGVICSCVEIRNDTGLSGGGTRVLLAAISSLERNRGSGNGDQSCNK